MLFCTYMYRINVLLKQKRKLFHTRDLALLWGNPEPNTLYTTIKRYVQKGILIPIHKGFYAVMPLSKLDPVLLGISYLHTYAYLSLESVLFEAGVIFQRGEYMTLVSSVSKKFSVGSYKYLVRKMRNEFLHNPAGISNQHVRKATLERAVADMLYFNPKYHFDNPKAIDWRRVKEIQKEVGYR